MKITMESRRWGFLPTRFRVMGLTVTVQSVDSYHEVIVRDELRIYFEVTCQVFGPALLYCDASGTDWHMVRQLPTPSAHPLELSDSVKP